MILPPSKCTLQRVCFFGKVFVRVQIRMAVTTVLLTGGMCNQGKCCHVPALRDKDKNWVTAPEKKAQLFADTFAAKYFLQPAEDNKYSELAATTEWAEDWEVPPLEEAKKTLSNLKEESATGPDGLPTRVLKRYLQNLSGYWPRWC